MACAGEEEACSRVECEQISMSVIACLRKAILELISL
jgi:hypothetical protein